MNNEKISNKWYRNYIFIPMVVSLLSLIVSVLVVTDSNRPIGYDYLFLLPFSFAVLSLLFQKIFYYIKSNLAIALFLILLFCRLVVSPLFMFLGNYSVTIQLNTDVNTTPAVFLVIYETAVIFSFFYLKENSKEKKVDDANVKHARLKISKAYFLLLGILFLVLVWCVRTVPAVLTSYRTIFQIGDEFFTHYEDSQVVSKYAVNFTTKLAIVTGQYLMRAVILLIPASIVVLLAKWKKKMIVKVSSFFVCFIPIFFISGEIARSLIYIISLLFMYNVVYTRKGTSKSNLLLFFGGGTVIIWWLFKNQSNDVFESFSRRFSSYFSGVNIVSGVFNLPRTFEYRLRYFVYDFIGSVPYGGTIFGISEETLQPFFNSFNYSQGQIPPTIGMGYYYFGPILAPIYSVVYAMIAYNSSSKIGKNAEANPFKQIRLIITTFYFSMGVIMYNIGITLGMYFSLILPMFIIEKFAYKKENLHDTQKDSLLLVRRQTAE